MSRACKLFRPTFPFAVLFSPFHRPHLVLLFILLSFSNKVLSSERNLLNDTHKYGISLPESEKMGRYKGRETATLDNQESFLEDQVAPRRSVDDGIDNIEENRENRSFLSLERSKDLTDSTNNDRCRFIYCATKVEGDKSKQIGFPDTILNLVSDVNVSDETTEASSSEPPFVSFESFQKFPVKVTYNSFLFIYFFDKIRKYFLTDFSVSIIYSCSIFVCITLMELLKSN